MREHEVYVGCQGKCGGMRHAGGRSGRVRGTEYNVGAWVRRCVREEGGGIGGRVSGLWRWWRYTVTGSRRRTGGSVRVGGGRCKRAAPCVGATSFGANASNTVRSSDCSSVPDPARERTRVRSVLPWSGHTSAPRVRALQASKLSGKVLRRTVFIELAEEFVELYPVLEVAVVLLYGLRRDRSRV